MVGRRRKTSDSTTGTLDPDGLTYLKELQVLKKYDAAADDPDGMLQTFVLEDAIVCDKTGRPVELFTVRTKGPFTVRGRVVLEPWQKSRALKSTTKSAWIETKDCIRYAIGQDVDNNYGAWASGQAGWYELRPPSVAYKAIYDHTIEGVTIYYMIMHIIEDHNEAKEAKRGRGKKGSKKRGKKTASAPEELTIENLLFKYAVAVGDGATHDEVVARCDDHAPFLISHFYEAASEFDWPPTVFFKWLIERHPDIHEDVLASRSKKSAGAKVKQELPEETEAIASPVATDEPPVQKTLPRRRWRATPQETNLVNNEVDTHDFAISGRSVRSSSRTKTKTESRSPPPAQLPNELMDVDEDVDEAPEAPPAEAKDNQAADKSNADLVLDALQDLEPELMPLHTAAFSKVSSKLYYKCKIKAYYSAAEILKYYAADIVERLSGTEWAGSKFYKALQETADAPRIKLQHLSVDEIPDVLVRRKTMAPRNGKTVKTVTSQSEAHREAVIETPPPRRPGRPAGKRSALRPGRPGSKRHADETPESVSRKIAKMSHAYDSDEDENMNSADSSDNDDDSSEPDGTESPTGLKVVVRAENIQTTEPTGPNGTWVCDEEGCDFVVRNPDQEQGRDLIQEHLEEAHYPEAENRDERIDLALTEGVKNHLPIDHLLEKIRAMGQKVQAKEEVKINDDIAPQPIKRRLIS